MNLHASKGSKGWRQAGLRVCARLRAACMVPRCSRCRMISQQRRLRAPSRSSGAREVRAWSVASAALSALAHETCTGPALSRRALLPIERRGRAFEESDGSVLEVQPCSLKADNSPDVLASCICPVFGSSTCSSHLPNDTNATFFIDMNVREGRSCRRAATYSSSTSTVARNVGVLCLC